MRKTALLIVIFFALQATQQASAQIDFNKALSYVGIGSSEPSSEPPAAAEQLPAVRPLQSTNDPPATAPHIEAQTPVVHHAATAPGVEPPVQLDLNQAVHLDCNCNQQQSCQPCQQQYEDECCLCKEDRRPVIPHTDPIYPATFDDVYRTPDCFRGFWETYPLEKARHCRKLQRQLNPPLDCPRECVDGPVLYQP